MKFSNKLTNRLKTKQVFYIKMANNLSLDERKTNELVRSLEDDPLFKRLKQLGVIKRTRRSNWKIASDFLEFNDSVFHPSDTNSDISVSLEKNKDVIPIVKQLGIEKFKEYFLYNENPEEEFIAKQCGIPVLQVKKILELVNNVFVISEFFHPSKISVPAIAYTKVARIENDNGKLVCGYYSINTASGEYAVDDKKLKIIKAELKEEQKTHVAELLSSLHLINRKRVLIHSIITTILDVQKQYFTTGKLSALKVYIGKDLSEKLEVAPSTISRAIYGKSMVTPAGEEVALSALLPSKKDLVKHVLQDILYDKAKLTDKQVKEKLDKEYNISVSRRLVCQCRNEKK